MGQFSGFTKEGVAFLKELKKNNNKQWFQKNRAVYDGKLIEPAKAFIVDLGAKLKKDRPGIKYEPAVNKSIFRINRDIRFSKDKTPYKSRLSIMLWEGKDRKTESPGIFFRLHPPVVMYGAGMHMFPPDKLKKYRDALINKKLGEELHKAAGKTKKDISLGGKYYKKIPRGYDADSTNAEFLLYNGLYAMKSEKIPKEFYTGAFVQHVYKIYKEMLPIHEWLVKVMK